MKRILVALMLAISFLGGMAPTAQANHGDWVSDKYYTGTRFKSTTICVQLKTSRTWLRDRVKEAVADWNDHTKLKMFVREDCSGYNKIKVYADYYGKYAKCGGSYYVACYAPGIRTKSKTSQGHWAYLITSATVKLNLSRLGGLTTAQKDSAITHELGHVGLRHIDICGSVMRGDWKCMVRESGTIDRNAMNRIYSQ